MDGGLIETIEPLEEFVKVALLLVLKKVLD